MSEVNGALAQVQNTILQEQNEVSPMPHITVEELLGMDEDNAIRSILNLGKFHRQTVNCLNKGSEIFNVFSDLYSTFARDDSDIEEIVSIGISFEEALNLSNNLTAPIDESLSSAIQAAHRCRSRRVRGILLQLSHKYYMFAITDILRLRVSPGMGYLRNEIEAFALMQAMIEDPTLAICWLNVKDDRSGWKFHQKTKRKIAVFRASNNLDFAWNMASGSSQHVRLASTATGLMSNAFVEEDREVHEIRIPFQEFIEGAPENYFLHVLSLLRTQERLFACLDQCLPEIESQYQQHDVTGFKNIVNELWQTLANRYPDRVLHWRRCGTIS